MNLSSRNFLLFCLWPLALQASDVHAAAGTAEPPFRYYSVSDGLTQSQIYDIEQDSVGYLWFTTARGLNRYNGQEFDNYTINDGLPTNRLAALYIGPDNRVWVGDARGGITVLHRGRIEAVIEPVGHLSTPITDIAFVDGRIFAVADSLGVLEVIATDTGYDLVALVAGDLGAGNIEISEGTVRIVAQQKVFRLTLEAQPALVEEQQGIWQLHQATDGELWMADERGRVGVWKDGELDVRAVIESSEPIVSIAKQPTGRVWVATPGSLHGFDGNGAGRIQSGADIETFGGFDELTALFVDRENTLWLASNSRLIRFLGTRFRQFNLKTGSDPETVWAITEDSSGRFWFGTQNKLLRRNLDESISVIGSDYGVPMAPVRDVVHDNEGRLWAGIRGKGLYVINPESLQIRRIEGTEGLEILDVETGNPGEVWFSTVEAGVFRVRTDDGSTMQFPSPGGTTIYTIAASGDGSVWYGADEVGLIRLVPNGGTYVEERFDQNHGLQHQLFDHIRMTGDAEAWIAMDEGGLYRFANGKFSRYGENAPFADQTVYLVEPLDDGTLIVGGEQGLYQFVPGSGRFAHYNQLRGFTGLETNVHATYVDSNGDLWIGTVDGAASMDTSQPMPQAIEPSPQLVLMETGLDGLTIPDGTQIEPDQRGVFIEFAAVSLINPKGLEYSYTLLGMDDEWGDATSNHSVSYSSIPPGNYEFMVRARYAGGRWGEELAARKFEVLPFFWQQPAFVLLALFVALFVIRAVMVFRTRNIERLNEKLRAQVSERTRSIEQARQHLQLSNEKLSSEIQERRKADTARAEVETRFRRAFENAPIGMGLLDASGRLFDANPALIRMFWPRGELAGEVLFASTMDGDDEARFNKLYRKLTSSQVDSIDENFHCQNSSGEEVKIVVNLSTVLSESGDFLYAVLQVQDVTESLKLTNQLEYQAAYDELTGLLNRRAFEAKLKQAWDTGNVGSKLSFLIFMDLDQFKVVNDTSGHAAGDQLLRGVSQILVDSVRADDTVCRLGGDEFGIILWQCPPEVARRIAESIRSSIENFRFHWDNETYRIGVSIGGVPLDPDIGDTGEIQQLADAACYAAKEAGRNRVHIVSGGQDDARVHRGQVRWVQRLREAMDNNRFAIYGQVIKPLDDASDEPERIEILLRLRDAETRRLIPPGAFLPAAERYGLSMELDEWVVRSLLDTLFIHHAFQACHRKYWINLSGTSIGDKRFATFLKDAIKRSPLPPGTVNFEITETAVIRSVVEAGKLMADLREMGCQFALDDFGSGLSSFGYLKKLPVDYLKIDGMFIRDILRDETDRIFVKSIIDIGHTLNIKTIAEFVENDEMLGVVRELGADYAQGFGIGRPFELAPKFPRAGASGFDVIELRKQAG
ncbi:MAG: EAL domain-containing protein [Gammaproteobacteria bacterium]|nr:EAL domain-containing protein [Gammaproteobacteria bacterium]